MGRDISTGVFATIPKALVKTRNKALSTTGKTKQSLDQVSELTTNRLSVYLRSLNTLEAVGVQTISSQALAEQFHLNAAQIRKDLAYFGEFGVRGVGYYVRDLKRHIRQILGLDKSLRVAIVVSRFNEDITGALLDGATRALREHGLAADAVSVARPCLASAPQAALSPIFGALSAPVAWQAWQTCSTISLPALSTFGAFGSATTTSPTGLIRLATSSGAIAG